MSQPVLKLYGERNTGTNYLAQLIQRNLPVNLLPGTVSPRAARLQRVLPGAEWLKDLYFLATYPRNLGWKHTAVKAPDALERYPVCTGPIVFVTITKNPYSWLLSLHNRPHHQMHKTSLSFAKFLSDPWRTVLRDNAPRRLSGPVELWNRKNRSYLRLDDWRPVVHLRYEDLLADPAAELNRIAQAFAIPWDPARFHNITRSTKDPGRTFESYQKYYLEEQWREKLTQASIAWINERLDLELVEQFGYAVIGSF